LAQLAADLAAIGGRLIIQRGAADKLFDKIIEQTGADQIVWNRRYEEDARARDAAIKAELKTRGLKVKSFKANLLTEPWERETKTGGYYKVFTPYWRAVRSELQVPPPIDAPSKINGFTGEVESLSLEALDLRPNSPDWAAKMAPHWQIGPQGAQTALKDFIARDGLRSNRRDIAPLAAFGLWGNIAAPNMASLRR